jgi:Arc/MetJ-type ribon-helix-helix transcriptional regulator
MKSPKSMARKKRGRPATGQDPVSAIRLPPKLTTSIDKWAARIGAASRSEAIRRLVELGLASAQPMKQRSQKAAAKASDMAARQIDRLANPAMPEEERRARKRRLIKGPREFREMRGDQPKQKD